MLIDSERRKALMWRSITSILLLFALLIFTIVWVLLVSPDMSNSINIAVLVISVLVVVCAVILIWVTWAISFPSAVPIPEPVSPYRRRRSSRALISAVCFLIWALFGVIWTVAFSGSFTFFQNAGVFVSVTILIMGIGMVAAEARRY